MRTTSTIASATATRVNLGPLTTTFIPPSDCTSLRFLNDNVVFMGAAIGYGCFDIQSSAIPCASDNAATNPPLPSCFTVIHSTTSWFTCPSHTTTKSICITSQYIVNQNFSLTQSCYPLNFASSFNPTNYDTEKWTSEPPIYSPGLACPSGYLPKCTVERIKGVPNSAATDTAANANNVIWSMLNDGEIGVGCCPSDYACDPNSPHLCTSQPHSGDIIAVTGGISCSSGAIPAQGSTALTAEAIRILLVKSGAPTATSNPLSKATSTPKKSSGKGEKIAVGIAVPLAVLVIAAAVFYFVMRRKRLRKQTADQEVLARGENSGTDPKSELPGSIAAAISGPNGVAFQKPELDNMQLDITPTLLELPADLSTDRIQELHGNSSTVEPNAAGIPASEPQSLISHDITISQQRPVDGSFDQDPGSTVVPELWDWSNFSTLGKPGESPRNSTAGVRK